MSSKKLEGDFISPLKIPSGAVVSPQRGNLTGIPRKVRDNCAELHNLQQRWNALNAEGLTIIRIIADIKRTEKSERNTQDDDWKLSTGLETQPEEHWNPVKPDELQKQCEALQITHQKMVSLIEKMKLISKQFKSMAPLHTLQQSYEESMPNQNPVFQTWPIDKYWEVCCTIEKMFEEEVASKRIVLENIAHTVDDDDLMFLMAVWTHDPYLTSKLTILTESLLVETKHR